MFRKVTPFGGGGGRGGGKLSKRALWSGSWRTVAVDQSVGRSSEVGWETLTAAASTAAPSSAFDC